MASPSERGTDDRTDDHPIDDRTAVELESPRTRTAARRPFLGALAGAGIAAAAGGVPVAAQDEDESAADDTDDAGETDETDDAEPEVVVDLEPPELPENIAIDESGTIYLSLAVTGEIRAVDPDGDEDETIAEIDVGEDGLLLGLVADDGTIHAAVNSGDSETHGVWEVDADSGDAERFAELPVDETEPNGIAYDPYESDAFLVSDHRGGTIWRVTAGEADVWADDELLDPDPDAEPGVGADGLAIDPNGDVYVDNLDYGRIVRVPSDDGTAGDPELVVEDESLVGADGLALDDEDRLYVAVNARDAIARIELEPDDGDAPDVDEDETEPTDDNGVEPADEDEAAVDEEEDEPADDVGETDEDGVAADDDETDMDDEDEAAADDDETEIDGEDEAAVDEGETEMDDEDETEPEIETIAEGPPLDFPADVSFGRTDEDETTLYACNFAFGRFQEDEDPEPSLVALDVGAAGAFLEPDEFVE